MGVAALQCGERVLCDFTRTAVLCNGQYEWLGVRKLAPHCAVTCAYACAFVWGRALLLGALNYDGWPWALVYAWILHCFLIFNTFKLRTFA